MVLFRHFRNDDPPHLVEIWNLSLNERGAVRLRHSSPLDNYILAKPYFDPAGLIVAEENGARLGFVHAGFRANAAETALSFDEGVICCLCVRPSLQREGIGAELLHRAEAYLTERGAQAIHAGPHFPRDPFYFGLYGGSNLAGFLESDKNIRPFLEANSYKIAESIQVLQLPLSGAPPIVDGRFPDLRRQFEVCSATRGGVHSWWQECVVGPVELVEFRLEDRLSSKTVARAQVWDMEGFSWRWNQPSIGIFGFHVDEQLRRRGLGKFLLNQLIRYLQEQYFSLVELQVSESNPAALAMLKAFGFQHVDTGHRFEKNGQEAEAPPAAT